MQYIFHVSEDQAAAIIAGLSFLAGAIEAGHTPGPQPLSPAERRLCGGKNAPPDPPTTAAGWQAISQEIARQLGEQDRQRLKPAH